MEDTKTPNFVVRRYRSTRDAYRRSGRITALDLARAIAIIGMVFAHMAPMDAPTFNLQNGFPSALFAVLAGTSMSIMMTSGNKQGGAALAAARHRMLLRGALIFAVGALLELFNSPIAVVLGSIAMIFLFINPLTRWRTRWIWAALVFLVLLCATANGLLTSLNIYDQWFLGIYPVLAWFAYGVVGILIHRLLVPASWKVALGLLIPTTGLAAWGAYTRYQENQDKFSKSADMAIMDDSGLTWDRFSSNFIDNMAHSGGLADVGSSICMSVAVICLCILLCAIKPVNIALYPLRAMGAISLTAYSAHAISAHWLLDMSGGMDPAKMEKLDSLSSSSDLSALKDMDLSQFDPNTWPNVWITIAVMVVFASLWKLFFRRGPVEAAISALERKGLRTDLPAT